MSAASYLLDSNICIYILQDEHSESYRRLQSCDEGDVAVSSITYAEVGVGVDMKIETDATKFDKFFNIIPVLPFDTEAARIYTRLPFRRRSFDRLIAAHALSLDLTLVTNNQSDFADVPGLKTENWAVAA